MNLSESFIGSQDTMKGVQHFLWHFPWALALYDPKGQILANPCIGAKERKDSMHPCIGTGQHPVGGRSECFLQVLGHLVVRMVVGQGGIWVCKLYPLKEKLFWHKGLNSFLRDAYVTPMGAACKHPKA